MEIQKITISLLLSFFLIGSLGNCNSKSESEDPSPLLLFLMGSSSGTVGDGCNFKTQFTICVPPGIGGK